jgi:hypothetical protein
VQHDKSGQRGVAEVRQRQRDAGPARGAGKEGDPTGVSGSGLARRLGQAQRYRRAASGSAAVRIQTAS